MSNVKISDLPAATTMGTTDVFPFTQSGTTKIATLAQVRPHNNIKDYGALGDGTTNDTAAFSSAVNVSYVVPTGTFLSTAGDVQLKRKITGEPDALLSATNASASFDYAISEAGAVLRDVRISAVSVQALAASGATTTDVTVDHVEITNTPGSALHHGIQMNVAGVSGWKITNSKIDADGYALLLNDTIDGSKFSIIGNDISSNYLDGIQLNFPTNSVKDGVVIGNIVKAGTTGSATDSGFPIGLASAQNWAVVGNVIPQSRREAFHIEDAVKTLAIVANVGRDIKRDGVHLLPDPAGESRGSVVVGNSLEADSTVASMIGLYAVTQVGPAAISVTSITRSGDIATVTTASAHKLYTGQNFTIAGAVEVDYNTTLAYAVVTSPTTFTYTVANTPTTPATGTITMTGGTQFTPAHVVVGNRVKDFDTGIDSAQGMHIFDGNVIEEATTAGIKSSSGILIGENLLSQQVGVPAVLVTFAGSGGLYGKVYSDKTPTAVMTRTSTGISGALRGFCFPFAPYVHAGGTTDDVPLVALPDLAFGRVIVRAAKNSAAYSFVSATIHWDGTTLTVTNGLRKNAGGTSGAASFAAVGGNLTVPIFIAAATLFNDCTVDFTGEWIVN